MQFLMISRRRTEQFSAADFAPHVEAEAEHARELYSAGTIRQIWHRGDGIDGNPNGACMVLEAETMAAARAAVEDLPLAKLGMLEIVSVIPLNPYRGFAPRGGH